MGHYRSLFDNGLYLGPQHFIKGPKEVTIVDLRHEHILSTDEKKKGTGDLVCHMYVTGKDGKTCPMPYKVPKSVGFLLSLMFGTDDEKWKGQKITLYMDKCSVSGGVEECVRVKAPDALNRKVRIWCKRRRANPDSYIKQ